MNRSAFVVPALVALVATLVPACAQQADDPAAAAPASPALDTDDKKTLYALGAMMARNLASFALSEEELSIVLAGVSDGVRGAEPKVPMQEYAPKIRTLAESRAQNLAEKEKEAGKAFCEKAAAEPGAVKTESGAIYIETEAGSGAQPTASDKVKLHYHGTLRDGTVFDSSVDRGEPATFPLSGVVPCFREGVSKMKVGGKAKLVCPSETAYGDRGSPPRIAPGATIIFEVELLGIEGQS
jgi:FKBP-type peptidyl-prolyl cis-trans isomerase